MDYMVWYGMVWSREHTYHTVAYVSNRLSRAHVGAQSVDNRQELG